MTSKTINLEAVGIGITTQRPSNTVIHKKIKLPKHKKIPGMIIFNNLLSKLKNFS